MPSLKRRSELISSDGSDEEDRDVTPLSSGSHSSRKRRRASDGSVQDDVPSHDDREQEETPPSSVESEDEEEYEIAATQAIREKHARNPDNAPAECGILESVWVVNFMCHKNYEFELGPLINFICGKNGSGKSAILTAIQLCLGGKASSTNRGQSLKDFIREGADSGSITVKIKNQGSGAYMPEEFGETIIVERHFSRSGATGFRIKSARGRVVTTKKADLDEICDHFSLQIDNPLNVLSQDMARQFITSSSASEKYKFFVKGVQLEQLDQDYRLIEDQLDNIDAKIEAKKPDIQDLEQKMNRAKEKRLLSEKHDSIRDKIRDYRRQIAWVQVQAQEEIRDSIVADIRETDAKIAQARENLPPLEAAFQDADRAAAEAKNEYERANIDVTNKKAEKEGAKEKEQDIKTELGKLQHDLREVKTLAQTTNASIEQKRADIAQEQQRISDLDGGGAAARLTALAEAKDALQQTKSAAKAHQAERPQLEADVQVATRTLEDTTAAREGYDAELQRRRGNVDQFLRDRGKADGGFHPKLPQLLSAISSDRRFAQKPIGPLGKHVRLLHPEWSSILEKSFGSTLESFIVTRKRDMDILNELKLKTGYNRGQIFIANGHTLNPIEPDESFLTVLRALEIDNEMVRNQLILHHNIEQTILISDMTDARNALYQDRRPRFVKQCFCQHPKLKNVGARLGYTRSGEASQDPILEFSRQTRMRTDAEAQLQSLRDAVKDAQSRLSKIDDEIRTKTGDLKQAKQAVAQHQRHARELKIDEQTEDTRIQELEDEIASDNVTGGKLEALEQALKEAEEQIIVYESSYTTLSNEVKGKSRQLKAATQGLRTLDEEIESLEANSQKLQAEAQKLSRTRAHLLGEKNNAIARIDDGEEDLGTIRRRLQEQEENIATFTEQASIISPRVNVEAGQTEEGLKKKFDKLREDYRRHHERIGGSREEIAEAAATTAEAYKKGREQLRDLEHMARKLTDSLNVRKERWKKFRSFIVVRAKANFTYLLSERSFRGKLKTNHRERLLELSVEPDITRRNGAGRGAKTLSGGEKSFSQICLLLAMWEAMGSPIRCLDEFDVFMDAVNRTMSVGLLIDAARRSKGRQFVLISPGTKADIKTTPDVHVRELAPPERDQRTLDEFRA